MLIRSRVVRGCRRKVRGIGACSLVVCCGLLVVVAMLCDPQPAASDEPVNTIAASWPQWRGATHDAISVEAGLAESWPDSGPPVLWTKEIGKGYSSFIAVGDRVWTQTQTLYEQAVVCLDAATGETIWSQKYGWPYDGGGLYPGPRATPTWHDGRIYYAAPEGTIGCLDATTGRAVWESNPKRTFHGRGTDFGCAASPLVVDGKVIVPVGGLDASVVALDAKDGTLVWKSGTMPASYASPLPITLNGRPRVVAFLENSLALIDLASGRLLWEDEFSHSYDEHSAAPLYREPLLMTAGPFRSGAKCYRLVEEEGAALKPSTVWETPKFSNDVASSVLVEGFVYGFDLKDAQSRLNRPSRGEFRCLNFETGQIAWSTDRVGHASVIVADGKLILFNDKGEVILARVNSQQYEELARVTVFQDELSWSAAAFCHGRLFLRTPTRAACLYLGTEPLAPKIETTLVTDIPHVRSFDPTPLLGGEREFPATVPEWTELHAWWLWSLAGLLLATICAMVVQCLSWGLRVRRLDPLVRPSEMGQSNDGNPLVTRPDQGGRTTVPRFVFWAVAILIGAIGSPLLNQRPGAQQRDDYVFLWPLVLWAALQLTLLAVTWAESQPQPARRRARWGSRLAGLSLLATSGLYFHLCRRLGLSIEWGFLAGFLPAFPVAALCARGLLARHRFALVTDLLCAAVSFSTYFWSCGLFLKWWLQVGS